VLNKISFRQCLIILSALVFIFGTFAQFKKTQTSSNNDFRVYYKTSQRIAAQDWAHIYTRDDGPMPFRYVPYTLMTLTWPNYFQEVPARKIWLVIQSISFLAGFYFLYLSLVRLESGWPLQATLISFLMTFRYYIDSLYCGQVAGTIFLCFSLGLYFYLSKKYLSNGFISFIPASLKIIPGLQLIHAFLKVPGVKSKAKLFFMCLALLVGLNIVCYFWLAYYAPQMHTPELLVDLWKKWLEITLADGEYYDGRSAKSQALRGVLLRFLGPLKSTETLWKILFLIGMMAIFVNWTFRNAKTIYQDAFSYCLGILAFIIFMPESLPYQIMKIAIPLAVLLSHPKMKTSHLYKTVVIGFMLFMTFATSDLLGRKNAEEIQYISLPFLVIMLLFFVVFKESWGKSQTVKI
jgi:hypothetical protein